MTILNDVHSQLSPTPVAEVIKPRDLNELRAAVQRASREGKALSVAGGRHAMGGQPFAEGSLHLDMTGLSRVLETDDERGLLHAEAGIMWPAIVQATQAMRSPHATSWGIRQKQTGVDDVTLGGSMAANGHGRGLLMQPIGDDIESLTLVTATGDLVVCNRTQNQELFSLVIGGYGLFGIIYSAKLRLSPRVKVSRLVDVIDVDDAANAIYRRIDEGCLYGDFQYAIDSGDEGFLRRGVFACYKPVDPATPMADQLSDLPQETWLKLIHLAHYNKKEAFRLYAQHYIGTSGQLYWSDQMQMSTYIPSYIDYLEKAAPGPVRAHKETLMIGEHYVPYDSILSYLDQSRTILRSLGTEVIYGTIRAIQPDDHSFLPWAKGQYGCVVFNLRVEHTSEGIERVATTFRRLIDAALDRHGSFFLTYHRFATAAQVERAYPKIREFFRWKRVYDPKETFQSEWYRHYRRQFGLV